MTRARSAVRVGAAALVIALSAAGCAGARNALGTNASACFKALPGAKAAVHNEGHLVGVRRVPASTLQKRLPQDALLGGLPPRSQLCVFAFRGNYTAGDVELAPASSSSGNYAIVAMAGLARPTVVAADVVSQLPTRFRHTRV